MAASRACCKRFCSASTWSGLIFVISTAGLAALYRRTGPIAIPGEIAITCTGLIGGELSLNIPASLLIKLPVHKVRQRFHFFLSILPFSKQYNGLAIYHPMRMNYYDALCSI